MNFTGSIKEKLLYILVNRAVVFVFFMSLLTIFLYMIGTSQGFVDSTQLNLLKLYNVLAIFLVTTSICGIVLNIIRFLPQKKVKYILRAGCYLLLVLFGTVTVLIAQFVLTLSAGI